MSTEPFIGEVKWLAFSFAPRGFAFCYGQSMSIAQYTALFSLIGTTYGGDGVQTFKLPDLQGRVPIGQGQAPGLGTYTMGEAAGNVTATMTTSNMPAHIHTLFNAQLKIAANGTGNANTSTGNFFGANDNNAVFSESPGNNEYMNPAATSSSGSTDTAGSGMPFNIANPYLVLNYSIALEGIFPSRN